jgi:hypothetical protein
MSTQSEPSPINNPLEALDALVAASRRPNERAEPRLATVGGTPLTPVAPVAPVAPAARASRLDAPRLDTPRPMTIAAGDRLESAMSEFVRRQVKPQAMPDPAEFIKREPRPSMLSAAAMGLAAAVAVACVVALLYVTMFPRERDAVQSFAAAAPPAAPPTHQPDNAASSEPSQFRALVAANGERQSATHEQSERLLQQFVQWRQKAALADKP